MPYKDKEKQRVANRASYRRNIEKRQAYKKALYQKQKAENKLPDRREYHKSWYQKNKIRLLERGKAYRAGRKELELLRHQKYVATHPEYLIRHNYNNRTRYRDILFSVLGERCIRCGFSDRRALQLDHLNGKGRKDYKSKGGGPYYYKYYADHLEEAKQKLQVLCANCNWIKRHENKEHR